MADATQRAAMQAERKALETYLKECDDFAIVPDVGGAWAAAWRAARAENTTPTLREAAQQALEALEAAERLSRQGLLNAHPALFEHVQTSRAASITALRAALAEQAAEQATHDNLRDTVGQAIHDVLTGWYETEDGTIGVDPFDSRNIDEIADAVIAVLPAAPAAEQAEPVAAERTRIADGLLLKFQSAVSNVTRIHREYMGIAMPEDVYSRFATLRDETIPALRSEILAMLAAPAAEQAEPAGYAPEPEAIANHLARALFKLGGEPFGLQCCRIEFKVGTYPHDERPGGGFAEEPLAKFFASKLQALFAAPPAPARQPAPALTVGILMEAGLMVGSTPDSVGTSNWAVRMLGALRALAANQRTAAAALTQPEGGA